MKEYIFHVCTDIMQKLQTKFCLDFSIAGLRIIGSKEANILKVSILMSIPYS